MPVRAQPEFPVLGDVLEADVFHTNERAGNRRKGDRRDERLSGHLALTSTKLVRTGIGPRGWVVPTEYHDLLEIGRAADQIVAHPNRPPRA